jgi:hypothetical protein
LKDHTANFLDPDALAGPVDLSFDFDFDFDQTPEPAKQTAGDLTGAGSRQRILTKAARRRFYDLSRVPNAVALLGELPKPGETVHAIMGGDFNAWDLVPAVLGMLAGQTIDLTITTLGFNLANNGNLCDLVEAGRIRKASIVCSDFFAKADPEVFQVAREKLQARGQRILATRNHSKLLLIATTTGPRRHFVIEGSANLRSCNNLEQIAVTNHRGLYQFHAAWIERLFAP